MSRVRLNLRTNSPGILKDDRAQALTEFVIVIPIVLLFFIAMLQYLVIVQAQQLGNYAAYVAARSYAVQAKLSDKETGSDERARDYARKAASMAMAPIARLAPGELMLGNISVGNLSGSLPQELPEFIKNASTLLEGYFFAYYVRFNTDWLGGSINISTSGDPKQVDVEINYPQPICIPGLAELWNFIGEDKIFTSLESLSEGLGGLVADNTKLQVFREGLNKLFRDMGVAYQLPNVPIRLSPYINIRSKCSMGYEDWGESDVDRPRKRGWGDFSETADSALEEKVRKMEEARDEFNTAQNNYKDTWAELVSAQEDYTDKSNTWERVDAHYRSLDEEGKTAYRDTWREARDAKNAAKRRLDDAQRKYDEAKAIYDEKKELLDEATKIEP